MPRTTDLSPTVQNLVDEGAEWIGYCVKHNGRHVKADRFLRVWRMQVAIPYLVIPETKGGSRKEVVAAARERSPRCGHFGHYRAFKSSAS